LICKANGAPKVSFSWSKRGVVLPNVTSSGAGKYTMTFKQTSPIEYVSTLLVQNVVNGDYDSYGCTARNPLGFSTHVVKLQTVSAPDPPYQLAMVNATHDTITICWKAVSTEVSNVVFVQVSVK
jgi:hypothetical protein